MCIGGGRTEVVFSGISRTSAAATALLPPTGLHCTAPATDRSSVVGRGRTGEAESRPGSYEPRSSLT